MAGKTNSRQQTHRRASAKPRPPEVVRDVYTATELAARIGIHRSAVYAGARAGRIPSIRVSAKRVIFPKAAIDRWLSEPRRASAVA